MYKVVPVQSYLEIEATLNGLTEEGWELVTISVVSGSPILIFKK